MAKPLNEHERVKYEFTGPLVFQCIKCKVIVGDSFAFVAAERDLNSVALYAKPHNIRVGTDLIWSKEGADSGSTFVVMYCNECNAAVGKVWRSTPRKFDYIRDMYSINLDNVKIYECGSYIDPEAAPLDIHTLPSASTQQMAINKLQDMVMMLHQRLSTLEYNMNMGQQN